MGGLKEKQCALGLADATGYFIFLWFELWFENRSWNIMSGFFDTWVAPGEVFFCFIYNGLALLMVEFEGALVLALLGVLCMLTVWSVKMVVYAVNQNIDGQFFPAQIPLLIAIVVTVTSYTMFKQEKSEEEKINCGEKDCHN